MEDETISEIMVNGAKQVYIQRDGRIYKSDISFSDILSEDFPVGTERARLVKALQYLVAFFACARPPVFSESFIYIEQLAGIGVADIDRLVDTVEYG